MILSVFAVVYLLLFIGSLFETPQNQPYQVNKNDPGYKYAKSRMQLEGYSEKDSDIAAQAIIKFQKAQQK